MAYLIDLERRDECLRLVRDCYADVNTPVSGGWRYTGAVLGRLERVIAVLEGLPYERAAARGVAAEPPPPPMEPGAGAEAPDAGWRAVREFAQKLAASLGRKRDYYSRQGGNGPTLSDAMYEVQDSVQSALHDVEKGG